MKEIKEILRKYRENQGNDTKTALATVVNIEGSSYRRIGARMIIFENGQWTGGISGGCLEGDVMKKANMVMMKGESRLVTYDTRDGDPYQIGVGLGCKGKIDIFIESANDEDAIKHFAFLESCLNSRKNNGYSLVMNQVPNPWGLKQGDRIYLDSNEIDPKTIRDDLRIQINKGESEIAYYESTEGKLQVLHEVLIPRIHVVVLGLHYDVPAMVHMCRELYWNCTLIGDPARFDKSLVDLTNRFAHYKDPNVIHQLELDQRTGIILMSHDYKTDIKYLVELIKTDIPYIGLLGPRKRFDNILDDLQKEGIELQNYDLNRIYSPVGLDIGAKTPEEIALSIVSEINAHFSGREGRSLKYKKGSIYGMY